MSALATTSSTPFKIQAMAWAEPKYSVEEVNVAARVLVAAFEGDSVDPDEFDRSYDIVNNWRVSHNFPLNTFHINLRYNAKRIDPNALTAQRIKRFSSILAKLVRSPQMKLSQMQDIGGCRAVVDSVGLAKDLSIFYMNESQIKHGKGPVDDYIRHPKASGYRGIHLIYRYNSDRKETYNGMKIEMQIRSRYQHAWATAVETAGTFMGQALKTSIGDSDWLRMFSLMSSVIAIRERSPRVPNTPTIRRTLIEELSHQANNLDVFRRLEGYAHALNFMQTDVENANWYLLELDSSKAMLRISGYRANELADAEEAYVRAEKALHDGTDAVLVSVESIRALSKAYPNYFADTGVFVELMRQALEGRSSYIPSTELKAKETTQLSLFS